jgi:ketosteroid isomerase-like protein
MKRNALRRQQLATLIATVAFACPLAARAGSAAVPESKPAVGTAAPTADEAALRQVAEAWVTRYNAGRAAEVAALYTEDGYYLSAHILAHGRPAIEAYWQRGIAAGGHLDFVRPLTVQCSGDLGYFVGTYQATNAGVTVDGRILIVATKVSGRWLMAAHETVVRDQP